MSTKKEAKERYIQNRIKLECVICKSKLFWEHTTLMNTPGMTILGIEWANKKATNYVCDKCGYVHWFLEK